MLQLVWDRRPTYNNDAAVAGNYLTTYIKLIYYGLFAAAYATVGSMCKLVMVNSTWTRAHVAFLWRGAAGRIHVVFPPCDTESLKDLSLNRSRPIFVSIGQFRPEKDHALQVRSFAKFQTEYRAKGAKLVLVGSCRGAGDEERVLVLRDLVTSLGINASVEFVLNQPYSVVKKWFAEASVGLHTMWNEHFGIGVVEMMAAGLVVIAHNSGGPKEDIVVPTADGQKTGFLAITEDEFAKAMNDAIAMDKLEARKMRERARESSMKFSDENFNVSFKRVMLESGLLI
jgi:alpha-1,2-mannosyltransferase